MRQAVAFKPEQVFMLGRRPNRFTFVAHAVSVMLRAQNRIAPPTPKAQDYSRAQICIGYTHMPDRVQPPSPAGRRHQYRTQLTIYISPPERRIQPGRAPSGGDLENRQYPVWQRFGSRASGYLQPASGRAGLPPHSEQQPGSVPLRGWQRDLPWQAHRARRAHRHRDLRIVECQRCRPAPAAQQRIAATHRSRCRLPHRFAAAA